MSKVEQHFARGCLGERQDVKTEKKGRAEVSKLVKQVSNNIHLPLYLLLTLSVIQLHLIHGHFDIEFHLLVSSFHPKTKLAKALWMEEYTSCNRWAELVRTEHHLLENFAKEATQCPRDVFKKPSRKPRAIPIKTKEQARLRQQLTLQLNQLVGKFKVLLISYYGFNQLDSVFVLC